ncbi:hypothetical protein [Methanobacterium alcaliphilum]|uniref:hypothetical protein n=1 Tax=Methanobacterium alcaliphilum TaxID=392018 RepID=UPI002009E91D|nr:hypothetical protein [Methanobacterium alcaliphilum]MCK9150426.1 hypothetical protein [Methanobacterium alcaliphilum]
MSILIIIGIILALILVISLLTWIIGVIRSKISLTLKPDGDSKGKAIIVYDPGMTSGTKNAAFYIGDELKSRGFEVKLAGVRSSDALDLSGADILVVGSPTYGAQPTGPVKTYLNNLQSPENIIAGVFTLAGAPTQDSNVIIANNLENKSIPVKVSTKYGASAISAPSDKNIYSEFVSELLG